MREHVGVYWGRDPERVDQLEEERLPIPSSSRSLIVGFVLEAA